MGRRLYLNRYNRKGRNTGIPKIKRALKNNGSLEPKFETNDTRDYFIITIFIHDGFKNKTSDKTSDKVLKYLQINEYITTSIASDILNLSSQRAILSKMAKDNIIILEGKNKNRKYKLK